MPIYCFKTARGQLHERDISIKEKIPKWVLVDGQKAHRDFQSEHANVPSSVGWPLTCVASGVHNSQAQELRDHFKRVGVPTEVTSDGDPVYRSVKHRRQALKARGFVDRSSFV